MATDGAIGGILGVAETPWLLWIAQDLIQRAVKRSIVSIVRVGTGEVVTQVVGLLQQIILNNTTTGLGETMLLHLNEALQPGIILVLTNKTITVGTIITAATETIGVDPMRESTTVDSAVVVHLGLVVAVELLLVVAVAVVAQEEEGTNLVFQT
jgi:hypothetical protein